ncbi:hypothetical protein RhiirB3_533636 [Rhizophagus irregularis]|nr:hypothetical protein RhiirB3_533636 [Rhizophagus irregularis]
MNQQIHNSTNNSNLDNELVLQNYENSTSNLLLNHHMLINTNNQEIANPGVYQAITRKRSKTVFQENETHDEKHWEGI